MPTLTQALTGLGLGTVVARRSDELMGATRLWSSSEGDPQARSSVHLDNFSWKEGNVAAHVSHAVRPFLTRVSCAHLAWWHGFVPDIVLHRRAITRFVRQLAVFHRWSLRNPGALTDREHRKLLVVGRPGDAGGRALLHRRVDWVGAHACLPLVRPQRSRGTRVLVFHACRDAAGEKTGGQTRRHRWARGLPGGRMTFRSPFERADQLNSRDARIAARWAVRENTICPGPRSTLRLVLCSGGSADGESAIFAPADMDALAAPDFARACTNRCFS
jgi:hypothetical protein